jgi:outer membrane lipoprotein-sorting protein
MIGLYALPIAQTPPDAPSLIGKMQAVYASCRSYRDQGQLVLTKVENGRVVSIHRAVRIVFERPDRFRFEHTQERRSGGEKDLVAIWSDRGQFYSWWSIMPGVRKHVDFMQAFRWGREVSGRGMYMVDLLHQLTADDWLWKANVSTAQFGPEEKVSGRRCYTVDIPGGRATRLWIDKESFLIRKVYTSFGKDAEYRDVTSTYSPELNVPIEASEFVFKPPARR